jgi:hypothetical protein
MTLIPKVKSFVGLERVSNGVSRVKFRVVYDEPGMIVREHGTTLRKARERLAQILHRNPHASQHPLEDATM